MICPDGSARDVGIEDQNTVLGNWNAGMPPGEASMGDTSAAIPEPASMRCLGGALTPDP